MKDIDDLAKTHGPAAVNALIANAPEIPDADGENNAAFIECVASAVMSGSDLMLMEVPNRPKLLGEWCRMGDLGFIYAPRGVGKTWLALLVSNALVIRGKLGEWEAGEQVCPVLYVDGEMNLPDFRWRLRAIGAGAEGLRILHHETVFEKVRSAINIADMRWQQAINYLVKDGSVLVLDNRSALCRGMEENSNDDWEAVLDWLLDLRRRNVTVIIVNHAGRNGAMRGASRPEDAAHWIIRLREDSCGDDSEKVIVSTFTKCRNCPPKDALPIRWTLEVREEQLRYTCEKFAGPDAVVTMVKAGITSATEIAEELGVSAGTVSKWAKKADLKKRGRNYALEAGASSD